MINTDVLKALGELPEDLVENFKNKEYDICKEKRGVILASDPNHGFAIFYIGRIAELEDDFETALMHYKRITEIEPRSFFVWSLMGEIYTKLGNHKEAYEAFAELIGLIPQKATPWCMASISAKEMGDHELAVGILKMAQEKVEKDGQSIISVALGTLYEIAGNKDEALVHYLNGQMVATDEENRLISAEHIYSLMKK